MTLFDNDQFLSQLGELFVKTSEHGSVFLTQKRLNGDASMDDPDKQYKILLRATDGKSDKNERTKISTHVDPESLPEFWLKYTEVVKAGMTGLRKKDKKKKSKAKVAK